MSHFCASVLLAAACAAPLAGQSAATGSADAAADPAPAAQVMGTVVDTNNNPIPNAMVVLQGPGDTGKKTQLTGITGFYEFQQLAPASSYRVTITASGFDSWSSPPLQLEAGKTKIVTGCQLKISQSQTVVNVHYSAEEVAVEEVHAEEQQRVFGVIPNFYVVYAPTAEPLSTKLKFRLALKVSTDVVTAAGVLTLAGVDQASDTPNFQQGWKGYGQRVGVVAADGFSNILIGGAVLPSLLHQDPRYFYKGEGSTKSRLMYAMRAPFVCKGDNGQWQPNYSSMGGDLAQSALSNAYYPASNRGVGLVFGNFAINTAERMLSAVVQEFVLSKFTTHGSN
ncbi:MAG: carboxypeptidase-like regulatory domain-containing protein [Acidobacteriota bacterium]|nr:carboxypeptidase-like regulatory domain-containing protein [Acidobacteriota bacterium]